MNAEDEIVELKKRLALPTMASNSRRGVVRTVATVNCGRTPQEVIFIVVDPESLARPEGPEDQNV